MRGRRSVQLGDRGILPVDRDVHALVEPKEVAHRIARGGDGRAVDSISLYRIAQGAAVDAFPGNRCPIFDIAGDVALVGTCNKAGLDLAGEALPYLKIADDDRDGAGQGLVLSGELDTRCQTGAHGHGISIFVDHSTVGEVIPTRKAPTRLIGSLDDDAIRCGVELDPARVNRDIRRVGLVDHVVQSLAAIVCIDHLHGDRPGRRSAKRHDALDDELAVLALGHAQLLIACTVKARAEVCRGALEQVSLVIDAIGIEHRTVKLDSKCQVFTEDIVGRHSRACDLESLADFIGSGQAVGVAIGSDEPSGRDLDVFCILGQVLVGEVALDSELYARKRRRVMCAGHDVVGRHGKARLAVFGCDLAHSGHSRKGPVIQRAAVFSVVAGLERDRLAIGNSARGLLVHAAICRDRRGCGLVGVVEVVAVAHHGLSGVIGKDDLLVAVLEVADKGLVAAHLAITAGVALDRDAYAAIGRKLVSAAVAAHVLLAAHREVARALGSVVMLDNDLACQLEGIVVVVVAPHASALAARVVVGDGHIAQVELVFEPDAAAGSVRGVFADEASAVAFDGEVVVGPDARTGIGGRVAVDTGLFFEREHRARVVVADATASGGGVVIGDLAGTGKRDGGAVVVDVDAGAVCSHVALDGRVAIHGDGGAVFQIEAAAVAAGPVARNLRAAAQGKLGAVVVIVNAAAVAIVGMVARHSRAIFERNRAV